MATDPARAPHERLAALVVGREPWILCGIAAVILVVHSLQYNFVTDDAYISFVFSRNFAEHGELAFNLGDPVEGYTNFSWTLVLGVLMLVGIAPEDSSRVLGTGFAIGTLFVVTRVMLRALRSPDGVTASGRVVAAVPALLLACSSGFACWSSGGLETQLFTFLVTVALDAFVAAHDDKRALRRVAIALALASMTRPEGPMLTAIFGALWVAHGLVGRVLARRRAAEGPPVATALPGRWRYRDELVAVAWFLGLWAPWFAWRWWYYGYPFPNTYYVKAHGPWAHPSYAAKMLDNGLYYVWVWVEQARVLYAAPLVVVGLAWVRPRTARFVLATACALLGAVYLAYAVRVGGDFMGLHRFIMPVFVCTAIPVALGLGRLVGLVPAHARTLATAAAAIALVVAFGLTQRALTRASLHPKTLANDRGIDSPAFLIVYTEDRAKIGKAMAPCFREDDFSIVGGAGAQPYYGRMRAIDVFGLVSSRIAHEEPRTNPRAGHTKWGSPALLAAHDPTFVFSCYDIHRKPTAPRLGCAAFWTARGFEQVTMHVPGMRERGEYYTFLAKKSRDFRCPGRVP